MLLALQIAFVASSPRMHLFLTFTVLAFCFRSEVSSPEPGSMPAERKSGEDGTPEHNHTNHTPNHLSPSYRGGAGSPQAVTNNHKPAVSPPTAVNGHSVHLKYPTGDIVKVRAGEGEKPGHA